MMDRQQLRRDCSDALEVLHRGRSMERIGGLAETLRVLGCPTDVEATLDQSIGVTLMVAVVLLLLLWWQFA